MRKGFITYLICWFVAIGLFNVVIFLIPSTIDGATIFEIARVASMIKGKIDIVDVYLVELADYLLNSGESELILDKYVGAFWPCYTIITVAFVGQLIAAGVAFNEKNNQKFFYKISLITVSYSGLITTLVFGVIAMFFPNFPTWLGEIICLLCLGLTIIAVLRANIATMIVSDKDEKIAEETSFMKGMLAKAKILYEDNKDNEDYKKLYEAFRYASPIAKDEVFINDVNKLFANLTKENIEQLIKLLDSHK